MPPRALKSSSPSSTNAARSSSRLARPAYR
jgi:hypothetical protein